MDQINLRPIKVENCPQFFTATILNWNKLLTPESYKLIIVESLQFLVNAERVFVYGYVIMDNHIHIIWKPALLYSLKHTQLSFMKFTAQCIKRDLERHHRDVLKQFLVASKDRVYQFWKRNALCVDLYSNTVIEEKLKYIHLNPVRAGMCANIVDYKFSSARFYEGFGDEFEFLTDFR